MIERDDVDAALLEAIESPSPVVLLIDEIDRADDEFEAFLLELLSDFQVTIPELGETIRAEHRPLVILTSNRTRELHDALKRRCLYHWIDYPTRAREADIVRARVPGVAEEVAERVCDAVARLRGVELYKLPGVGETIAWAQALIALGGPNGDLDDTVAFQQRQRIEVPRGLIEIGPDRVRLTKLGLIWHTNVILEFFNSAFWNDTRSLDSPNWSLNGVMVEVGAKDRSHWLGEKHETFFPSPDAETIVIAPEARALLAATE